MGFHQALNFAKLMRREAHTARNGHVMQPKFGGGSALRACHGQESTRQRALCSLTWVSFRAVARVTIHGVIALAGLDGVVTLTTIDQIVVLVAVDRVVAGAAQ